MKFSELIESFSTTLLKKHSKMGALEINKLKEPTLC